MCKNNKWLILTKKRVRHSLLEILNKKPCYLITDVTINYFENFD